MVITRRTLLAAGSTALVGLTSGRALALNGPGLASGGHVLVMRHALAPGTGDPAGFELDDCSTQRNLNETGREQARAWGRRLRSWGVGRAGVWSSRWCRCLETARLLKVGPVTPLSSLNSFFRERERGEEQTEDLRRFLANLPPRGPLHVLVTHQVNVTALTGVYPGSGEAVALKLTGDQRVFGVLGTLDPPSV